MVEGGRFDFVPVVVHSMDGASRLATNLHALTIFLAASACLAALLFWVLMLDDKPDPPKDYWPFND